MTIDFHPTTPRPVEETEPLHDSRETNPPVQRPEDEVGLVDYNEELKYFGERVMP